MAKGVFIVETRPASADQDVEYNRWYDEIHIPDILAVEGFVSARRFAPVDGDGPYVAVYEIEADDIGAVREALSASAPQRAGRSSDALQKDPPPNLQWLELIADHSPSAGGR